MHQQESLKLLQEFELKLDKMTPSEKKEFKQSIDEFFNQEENKLKKNFLSIIISKLFK